ncbi:MAG: hypothetical protein M5R36_26670 [Deltaproteobacteria bacterium]|nr:hypothetical protein [Deltaproteobacteria bacterium]
MKWPGDPVAAATGPAWIAPLAVSYLGFQLIHFAVERARGNIAPDARSSTFWSYALFFPTLPAGPIKRYENFRAQAESAAPFDTDLFTKGVFRVAVGFAKKSVLAYPAYVWLDGWQGATESAVAAWLGVYCYFAYIYLDFSAYSDIAIGAAAMMGLRVEENFRWPIFASNPSEFWKRWHMTMTGFLRDYVFIPLGGSREGALQTAVNTIITMTLIGLWHGIAWNFLAWGLYHAALLLGYRVWRNILPTHRLGRPGRALGVLATFHLVGAGWILFDNPFRDALPLLRALAPF